jgi:hypothetical protein
MNSIFIDYELLEVFEYFLKYLLCYNNSKTIQKIRTMWLQFI